jgi:hypothetical protein
MDKKEPRYEWVEEEGMDDVTPSKRKIAKTMEITETFNFYDTLKYVMKMEKAVEDKKAEIAGMESMIKAYRDEIELIEKNMAVTKMDEEWNLALHEKLKAEAEEQNAKKEEDNQGDKESTS